MLAIALAAVLGASACSGDLPSVAPRCDNQPAMQLIAQAVPEARQVPCFPTMPFGFEATTFDVHSAMADLRLSHAVIGKDAILLTLAASCTSADGEPADRAPTDGAQLTRTPDGGVTGQILFDVGACLLVDVRLDHPDGQRALDDFLAKLQLLDRSEVA